MIVNQCALIFRPFWFLVCRGCCSSIVVVWSSDGAVVVFNLFMSAKRCWRVQVVVVVSVVIGDGGADDASNVFHVGEDVSHEVLACLGCCTSRVLLRPPPIIATGNMLDHTTDETAKILLNNNKSLEEFALLFHLLPMLLMRLYWFFARACIVVIHCRFLCRCCFLYCSY